jgi:hypothetical protein
VWLLDGPIRVRRAIEGLFQLTLADRDQLRNAFWNDVNFHKRIDDPNFDFLFPYLNQPIKECGKALMVSLYEDILGGNGFTVLPHQVVNRLNLIAVELSYRESNPLDFPRYPCPACLVNNMDPVRDGKTSNDREHYFPKSSFAPIALHPDNIVLLCKQCNSVWHGEKLPAYPGGPGSLQTIFLPYYRAGIDRSDPKEDAIRVDFNPGAPNTVVKITGNHLQQYSALKVRNIVRIYNLNVRWSDALYSIHDSLVDEVCRNASNRDLTVDIIENVLRRRGSSSFAKRHSVIESFLEYKYIRWIINENITTFFDECIQAYGEKQRNNLPDL